jgi:large subunit ribosomal protein L19
MNNKLLKKVEENYYKNDFNAFNVGDTVTVHNIIREGEKSRVQKFKGVVINKKGSGTRAMFTVRKISDGVGVEKIFPVHSPNVDKIDIDKRGSVRRSKLFYLRERIGKSALKVKQNNKVVLKQGELSRKKEDKSEVEAKADADTNTKADSKEVDSKKSEKTTE